MVISEQTVQSKCEPSNYCRCNYRLNELQYKQPFNGYLAGIQIFGSISTHHFTSNTQIAIDINKQMASI